MLSSPHRAGAALETYKELDRFSRARLRCAGELLIGAAVAGRVRSDRMVAAEQRLRRDGIPIIGTILNDWNPKADGYGGYPPRYQ